MPTTLQEIKGYLARYGADNHFMGDPYDTVCFFNELDSGLYEPIGFAGPAGVRGVLNILRTFEREVGPVEGWDRGKGGILKRINRPGR